MEDGEDGEESVSLLCVLCVAGKDACPIDPPPVNSGRP